MLQASCKKFFFSRESPSFVPSSSFLAEKFLAQKLTPAQWNSKLENLNSNTISIEGCLPTLIALPSLSLDSQNAVNWELLAPKFNHNDSLNKPNSILECTGLLYSISSLNQTQINQEFHQYLKSSVLKSLSNLDRYTFTLAMTGLSKSKIEFQDWEVVFDFLLNNRMTLSASQLLEGLIALYSNSVLNSFDLEEIHFIMIEISKNQSCLSISDVTQFAFLCQSFKLEDLLISKKIELSLLYDSRVEITDLVNLASTLARSSKGTNALWERIVNHMAMKDISLDEGATVLWAASSMGQDGDDMQFLFDKTMARLHEDGISHETLVMLLLSAVQMKLEDSGINNLLRDCVYASRSFIGPELMILTQHVQNCLPGDTEYRAFVKAASTEDPAFLEHVKRIRDTLSSQS